MPEVTTKCLTTVFPATTCLPLTPSAAGKCSTGAGPLVNGASLLTILGSANNNAVVKATQAAVAAYLNNLLFGAEAKFTQAEITSFVSSICRGTAQKVFTDLNKWNNKCPLGSLDQLQAPVTYRTSCGGLCTGNFLQVCYATKYTTPCTVIVPPAGSVAKPVPASPPNPTSWIWQVPCSTSASCVSGTSTTSTGSGTVATPGKAPGQP